METKGNTLYSPWIRYCQAVRIRQREHGNAKDLGKKQGHAPVPPQCPRRRCRIQLRAVKLIPNRVANTGSPGINPPRWRGDLPHPPPPLESRWKFLWALHSWGEAPLALRPSRCGLVQPKGICLGFGSWSGCECTRAGKGLLPGAAGAGGCGGMRDVGVHRQPPAHGGQLLTCSSLPTKKELSRVLPSRQSRSPAP